MSEYLEILRLEWGPVQYELGLMNYEKSFLNWYIKMRGIDFPRSIYITEFEYLKNLIITKQLKNGFECGTAFGVSAIALGLGFKETCGHLVTMDGYIEEKTGNCVDYRYEDNILQKNSYGFKSVNFLIEHFKLKKIVKPEIGLSPEDVGKCILKHTSDKLDFVFIDAGHFPEQLIKDLYSVKPFLDDNYVIVLHDCFSDLITPEVERVIELLFGYPLEIVVTGTEGYNLGIIDNKKI
jgi:hypothetical protein